MNAGHQGSNRSWAPASALSLTHFVILGKLHFSSVKCSGGGGGGGLDDFEIYEDFPLGLGKQTCKSCFLKTFLSC